MNDLTVLKRFAKRYAEAWCSQDSEKVAAFFAERGSISINNGPPAVGRAAIAEIARGFMRDLPDIVVIMDRVTRDSDGTKFHWTFTGTNTGPGGTGKRVRISGYELWQIGNHRLIAESKGHFDAADYERQLKHGKKS
jgi:predicted ester cyclase